jgi:hypothetical protein
MTPRAEQESTTRDAAWFYERALDEADRDDFVEALEVDGLDEEVAPLRLHLRRLLEESPEDSKVIQAGVRLLINALIARRRLTDREAEGLGEAAANLIEEFGEVLRGAPDA